MKEMKVKKNDWVYLEKLSDDRFEGKHPNGYPIGYVRVGELCSDIEVGEMCELYGKRLWDYFHTSEIIKILDDYTFKTKNSTYKIIPYNKLESIEE